MASHPIDFEINPHIFSTSEIARIFDEKTRYQRWLDFEAALAKVQGEMGVIPKEAAEEIGKKAKLEHLDLESVREGYLQSRNSLMPLISGLRKACHKNYGEYVHYGPTTQDVLDTALVLELRDALKLVYRDLRALEGISLELAERHKTTPMVARTHGQQALPTTFGFKVVIWANEIRRHIERVQHVFEKTSFGQLGGAVGTMAALGPQGIEIAKRTLGLLGLKHSTVAWHNSRDNIGELASILSLLMATVAKMANEIFQLQKTEIGELKEPSPSKAVTSTTMPHKQNPVICQRIEVLSRHVRYLSGVVVESMVHEHERDARSLWSEWLAMPQLCIYTGTALQYMLGVMFGLVVSEDRMLDNLHLQKAQVASEWLVFRLSGAMGKMKALEKINELSKKASGGRVSLKDVVTEDAEMGSVLAPEDLTYLEHPEKYIGHAVQIVERVVEEVKEKRAQDPEKLN
jgi:adenylosuccinate lyase